MSESDNSQDFSLALSVAPYFRLDEKKANKILSAITSVVKTWRVKASELKIPRTEILKIERAFRLADS